LRIKDEWLIFVFNAVEHPLMAHILMIDLNRVVGAALADTVHLKYERVLILRRIMAGDIQPEIHSRAVGHFRSEFQTGIGRPIGKPLRHNSIEQQTYQ